MEMIERRRRLVIEYVTRMEVAIVVVVEEGRCRQWEKLNW